MSEGDSTETGNQRQRPRVGLLVTCLIDALRPEAGFSAVRLLEQAGCEVIVPAQGCCGQPNFNGGDELGTRQVAAAAIEAFADCDYVVVPSGSCAAMLRVHYPELFTEGSVEHQAAVRLAERTWELTSFLHDVLQFEAVHADFKGNVVVHDACSALRELNIREQPRALLSQVTGCREVPLENPDVCCGFGGMFCVKYPEISGEMATKKIADIHAAKDPVDMVVSTDLGCLLHLEGRLRRAGDGTEVRHIAELLADQVSPGRKGDPE